MFSTKKRGFVLFVISALAVALMLGVGGIPSAHAAYGSPTRYEAESTNLSNATVASTYTGYSGTGYVTGMTSQWSKISFDKGVSSDTLAKMDIRYANGTGATVTNLSLYVGSNKVQGLSLPATTSWSTWATVTVTFTIPAGYQNIIIKSEADVSSSANIDYMDLYLDDGQTPVAPGSFSQTAPAAGATGVSTTPAFTWGASSGAASYSLVVSTSSSYTSPVINVNNLSGTSYTPTTALASNTLYYWKVTATNAAGSTDASNAGLSFTTSGPPPVPGSFSQTAPVGGATGVSVNPTFTWGASSSAASYTLVASTNSNYSSPAINVSNLTGTSYNSATALATSTKYYWKVTATNATGSTDASNAGLSFTTAASSPYGPPTRYEAESTNLSNATVASTYTGYSGTGYVTGMTSQWSKISFDKSVNSDTLAKMDIRYANGTGATVSNLSLYIGSTKVQGLSLPATASWSTWATVTVTFTIPAGYQNIYIKSEVDTSSSANIDYMDLYLNDGVTPVPPGNFNQTSPAAGATGISTTPTFSWSASTGATGYSLVVSTSSSYASPVINVNNLTGTSYDATTALATSTLYYWKVTATNTAGSTDASNAGISFTTIVPPPLPGAFTQTAPAAGATSVSVTPTFTWGASSSAAGYTLVVSTNSNYSSPAINVNNLTGTSYTSTTTLANSTKYYWKVTATNSTGSTDASNAGLSFTTAAPTPPGTFSQTSPVAGATSVNVMPDFTWTSSSGATSYTLVVSTNSNYSSPAINVSNLTSTAYTPGTALANNTLYYWKVTATSAAGSTVATNAGLSFTTATAAVPGSNYYVSTTGSDTSGNGTAANPWKTLAYAATQVPAGQNDTINLAPGTYYETVAVVVPLGVNIKGSGQSNTTITSNGPIPAPGVDQSNPDWKLWYDGSLIQLISPGYSGANPKYGSPDQMVASANGNQTLSDFTVDGNNRQIKAGVWVEDRNNVTMYNVTFKNFQMRGAVFGRSDMWWYIPMPDGMWMYNTVIHDCTFINSGSVQGSESLGNLNIAGLDGADIYNINVNDLQGGFGIKFIFVGHFRNVKIHDTTIRVSESDPTWGEKAAIEMWNLSYGNQIYNIDCNTWMSFVNHAQLTAYEPTGTETNNLKLHDVRMVDQDGVNGNEAIEAALSGLEIYNNYIQDKGFGIAIWCGSGSYVLKNYYIHNNIIANVNRTPNFGFGNSSGVFVPDAASNIQVYNNVFDTLGNGLELDSASNVDVKNNVFLNTQGADVQNGSSVTFNNNLKYSTDPTKAAWNLSGGPTLGSGNLLGDPGFKKTGSRWDTYYQPASASSLVVDKGTNVGLPFNGSAPDIGRWEY